MKLKQIKYHVLFLFMLNAIFVYSNLVTDTIRLKLKPLKKEKEFHKQPLLLKTNPLAILWGPIPFTAEYRLISEITTGQRHSEQIGISFLNTSPLWKIIEKTTPISSKYKLKTKGWRIQYAHRFYLIKRKKYAPFGFYVSPTISYSNAQISIGLLNYYRKSYYNFSNLNINLLLGYQFGKNSRFTVDIFSGIGYKKNTVFYHVNSYKITPFDTKDFGEFYNSDLKLSIGINFGWAFY